MFRQSATFFSQPTISIFSAANFSISTASKDDAERLAKVARKTYEETYPGFFTAEEYDKLFGDEYIHKTFPSLLADEKIKLFVAKKNEKIIGYAKLVINNDFTFLDKLYVLKKYQGVGLGSRLLQQCYSAAYEQHQSMMKLRVYDTNTKVVSFYEKNGFKLTGEKEAYYMPDKTYSGHYDYYMMCEDIRPHMKQKNVLRLS